MKRILTYAVLAAAGAAFAGVSAGAEVSARLSGAVATEQVSMAFPGEDWVLLEGVDVAGADGETVARAFVFGLEDSPFADVEAVRAALAAGESGDDGESELYASTATVVTGARDTDPLAFSQFRGLPSWYAELAEAEAAGRGGEALWVGAGDIRFSAAAPDGARAVSAASREARRRAAVREAVREELDDKTRALMDEAEAEAAAVAQSRWADAAERASASEK